MDKKIVWFLDRNKEMTSLEIGDIIFDHTGLKADVYQRNDVRVISGKKKVGEAKTALGYV